MKDYDSIYLIKNKKYMRIQEEELAYKQIIQAQCSNILNHYLVY